MTEMMDSRVLCNHCTLGPDDVVEHARKGGLIFFNWRCVKDATHILTCSVEHFESLGFDWDNMVLKIINAQSKVSDALLTTMDTRETETQCSDLPQIS